MRLRNAFFCFALALAAPLAMLACSASDSSENAEKASTMRLALSTTTTAGDTYQLASGTFTIVGASTTTVKAEDHLAASVITTTLATGTYSVTLGAGWSLKKLVDGAYVNVDATLTSANPATVTIVAGVVTDLAFQFQVGEEVVVIGAGTLQLSVGVAEVGCQPITLGAFWAPTSKGYYRANVTGLTDETVATLTVDNTSGTTLFSSSITARPSLVVVAVNDDKTKKTYIADTGTLEIAADPQPATVRGISAVIANARLVEADVWTYVPVVGGACLSISSASVAVATVVPPAAWTCSAGLYDSHDGCDCNCGTYDPDCSRTDDTRMFRCALAGATCDSTGTCVGGIAEWTCSASAYNSGGSCNCGCGVHDPDCDDEFATVVGCAAGATCSATTNTCVGGLVVPSTWTCAANMYGNTGACNCNCGAYDPDCASATATEVRGCTGGAVCSATGTCTGGIATPSTWTCNASYFGSNDGCDCNCGAYDPDCGTSTTVLGCASGQTCSATGVCQ